MAYCASIQVILCSQDTKNQNSWQLFLCSCRPTIPLVLLPVPLHQQLRFLLHNKKRVGVFALIKYAISFFFLRCLSFCYDYHIKARWVFFSLSLWPHCIPYWWFCNNISLLISFVIQLLIFWFQSLRIFSFIIIIIFISFNFIHAFFSFFQSWGYRTCQWVS